MRIYPTGIKELDKAIGGGFRDSTLNLVIGQTASGKSSLLEKINSINSAMIAVKDNTRFEDLFFYYKASVVILDDFQQYINDKKTEKERVTKLMIPVFDNGTTFIIGTQLVTGFEKTNSDLFWNSSVVIRTDSVDQNKNVKIKILKNRYEDNVGMELTV